MNNNNLIVLSILITMSMIVGCRNSNNKTGLKSSFEAINKNTDNEFDDRNETKIGRQIWSTKNLNVSTFKNGDTIPEVKSEREWSIAAVSRKPAWCYYDNSPSNGKKYGKLYNWFAVIDPRGLAPSGWHIATFDDWSVLVDFLGVKGGLKIKSTGGWQNNDASHRGSNTTGFDGLPGGYRIPGGGQEAFCSHNFCEIGMTSYWWSSTVPADFLSREWHSNTILDQLGNLITSIPAFEYFGLSVRCLRD